MKIAVSNSSPLILLAKVNSLHILLYFFDQILIPPAVFHEVVENGIQNGQPDAILINNLVTENFIQIKTDFPHNQVLQGTYSKSIHLGEVEAIELAISLQNRPILLDDEEARELAWAYNLKVKGTLGLLIDYRKAKQISHEEAIVLLNKLNEIMYLSADLFQLVLKNI